MSGNSFNFALEGTWLSDFLNDVDTSNTVNGKSIYYLVGQNGLSISPSAFEDLGYLVLVNSTNIHIANLNITYNGEGVLLAYTNSSTIENTFTSYNHDGIELCHSYNNIIMKSNVTHSFSVGIKIDECSKNVIEKNNITMNGYAGIYLFYSEDNMIRSNFIMEEDIGIEARGSAGNIIHLNNFINNTHHAYVSPGYGNFWDNGYPSGGNYWDNYEESYPDAEELDDSGIWNTPYVIDENNQDNYPLVEPACMESKTTESNRSLRRPSSNS